MQERGDFADVNGDMGSLAAIIIAIATIDPIIKARFIAVSPLDMRRASRSCFARTYH